MMVTRNERDFLKDWGAFLQVDDPTEHFKPVQSDETWTRFHALPKSKRYATSSDETQTILKRANTLGDEILGIDTEVWCIIRQYRQMRDHPPSDLTGWPGPSLKLQFSLMNSPYFDTDISVDIYAGLVFWGPGRFDDQLLQIADDGLDACWLDPLRGRLFAPYDGGFDVFLESPEVRDQFEVRYQDWMPGRADKL